MTINDSHIDPQMTFKKLVFLNMQQLTNFPYIEKDFDALTDYQLLCKVVEYLNMVIKNSNDQNDSITNLYNAFLSLQTYVNTNFDDLETAFNNLQTFITNYFDNLDVQEEINNKLDDMLESGQLEQIIEQFIQSTAIWCFDTVADMKLATNLINGSFARTLGYYSVNDKGSSTYKIRNKEENETPDEMFTISISTTLVAELIFNEEINTKQLGITGDGLTDETSLLQNAIDKLTINGGTLNIIDGTYMIDGTTSLILKSNVNLDFNNAKLKCIPQEDSHYQVLYLFNTQNNIINNAVIEGERDEHTGSGGEWGYAVYVRGNTHNIYFNNLTCKNCWGDGVFFYRNRVNDIDYIPSKIYFNGTTYIENCRRQGVSMLACEHVYFDNLICKDINGTLPMAGIDIESEHAVDLLGDIHINYLKCIGTNKCFTLRNNSKITGNITIGTIEQVNPITSPSGTYDVYLPAFIVHFNYFDATQGKYVVSVNNIIEEEGVVTLEDVYKGYTPRVVIGNIHTKNKTFISDAAPDSSRGIININYLQTTNLTDILGGIEIDNIVIDNLEEIQDRSINARYYSVYYGGNNTASDETLTDVLIQNIKYINKDSNVSLTNPSSNVKLENVYINTNQPVEVIRQNSNKALIPIDGRTYYYIPLNDFETNKTLTLRVSNALTNLEINTKGKTTFVVNTAYNTALFSKVYLNDTEVTGTDGVYSIGEYTSDTKFIIKTQNNNIYITSI